MMMAVTPATFTIGRGNNPPTAAYNLYLSTIFRASARLPRDRLSDLIESARGNSPAIGGEETDGASSATDASDWCDARSGKDASSSGGGAATLLPAGFLRSC